MSLRPPVRTALLYFSWLLAFSVPPNLALHTVMTRTPRTRDIAGQIERYRRERTRYDMLYLGDSRAVLSIDPEQIDPLLGTHSLNLAHQANRLATQYASDLDLLPVIPPGTTVVWSIDYICFRPPALNVNLSYPLRPYLVPRLLAWGWPITAIQDNVASSTLDVIPAHEYRDRLLDYVVGALDDVVPTPGRARSTALVNQARYDSVSAYWLADSTVEHVTPWADQGEITSAEVRKRRGGWVRIELDSAYFRARQRDMIAEIERLPGPFTPTPWNWNTFTAILDLFQRHHVRLIVNEIGLAPFTEHLGENQERYGVFMRRVRAEVERRGIPYVHVPSQQLSDTDFFDSVHMNSRGIEHFTPLLAAALKPHLESRLR